MPLYVLGLMGMTRRMQHYDVPEWQPWLVVAAVGALIVLAGIVLPDRAARGQHPPARAPARRHRRSVGRPLARMVDAVAAAGLQLRASCPTSTARKPTGRSSSARAPSSSTRPRRRPTYDDIEMPRNSPTGFVCAFFATHHRLRADLAHLVAGRRSGWSAPTRPSSSSPGATITKTIIPADEVAPARPAPTAAPSPAAGAAS